MKRIYLRYPELLLRHCFCRYYILVLMWLRSWIFVKVFYAIWKPWYQPHRNKCLISAVVTLGNLSDIHFILEWSDLTLTSMNLTTTPSTIPHEVPKIKIVRVANKLRKCHSVSASLSPSFPSYQHSRSISVVLPVLPEWVQASWTQQSMSHFCCLCKWYCFGCGSDSCSLFTFSYKSDSATMNAITASTMIWTSTESTADDNENNECTGGIHYGLNFFADDDCVWCFLCVSDKIKSNLSRSWPSAVPLTNIIGQLVICSFGHLVIYG